MSKHVDAFGTEVAVGDAIAFCFTKWQCSTRMVKGVVTGCSAKSFHVAVDGCDNRTTILKVKAVKL